MSSRRELLERYGALPADPRKKKRKQKKEPKNSTTRIIDDTFDVGEKEDDSGPEIVTEVDFETKFKKQGEGWEMVDTVKQSPPVRSRRKSPSLSPRKSQDSLSPRESVSRSPSPRGSPRRRSPTPETHGLQSAEEFQRNLDRQRSRDQTDAHGKNQATVYRDEKGRIIDVEAQKAFLERQKLENERAEAARKEWTRGLAQVKEEKAYRERLAKEKESSLAVYADDVERNELLKEKVHWGDTMAAHVSKKKSKRGVYQGPYPPNRFNIPPGVRWDGIDRSNGWEVKWFQAQNARNLNKSEYHRWATEDM